MAICSHNNNTPEVRTNALQSCQSRVGFAAQRFSARAHRKCEFESLRERTSRPAMRSLRHSTATSCDHNLPDRKAGWLAVWLARMVRVVAAMMVVPPHHRAVAVVDELTNLYRTTRSVHEAIFANFLLMLSREAPPLPPPLLPLAHGFNICKQLAICTNY